MLDRYYTKYASKSQVKSVFRRDDMIYMIEL